MFPECALQNDYRGDKRASLAGSYDNKTIRIKLYSTILYILFYVCIKTTYGCTSGIEGSVLFWDIPLVSQGNKGNKGNKGK
jgi:hypothetical protein